jgi:hypothetical protein
MCAAIAMYTALRAISLKLPTWFAAAVFVSFKKR